MNLKDKTLDITIKDYLLSGGIKHINPYADFKINEFKRWQQKYGQRLSLIQ